MVNLDPYVAQYMLVNEDDDEYATYDNINEALAKLLEFPNDHIEVTLKPKPKPFSEWLITWHAPNGDSRRLVMHGDELENIVTDATRMLNDKYGGGVIDSVVRQEPEPEPDLSCTICGDPRGH